MGSRCRRCGAFLIALAACGTPAWPREPSAEIEHALSLTLVKAPDGRADMEFQSALAAAGEEMSEEECTAGLGSERASMQHKLLAIAAYQRLRPDLFSKIAEYYSPSTTNRAMFVRDLDRDHALESFRLVWEFRLLAPYWDLARQSVEALSQIANPASVSTLRYVQKIGRAPSASLLALAQIPCREAAEAVSEILGEAEQRSSPPSHPEEGEEEGPPNAILVESISGLIPEKRAGWLALLGDVEATQPAFARFSRAVRARLSTDRAVELTYVIPERVAAEGGDARLVRGRIDMAAAEFDAALTAAAEALGPDGVVVPRRGARWGRERDGIVARMGEIAVDRARRRERYEELQRTYVRRNEPPPLRRGHVSEDYRLAWELLIVMPVSSDASAEFRSRAAEAIGAIGNPDSAATVAHAISVRAHEDVPLSSTGNEAQRRLMDTLLRMPSTAGAEAVHTALRDIEHQQRWRAHEKREGGPRWDAKTYVVDAVVGMPAPARDAWLAVTDRNWPESGELRARLKQDAR
jgi:hypothetical protein